VGEGYKYMQKIEQQRRKRENTQKFVYPFRYNVGERSSLFHYNHEFLYKEISKGLQESVFKPNSTESHESLPVTKRLNPSSVSPR